MFSTRSALVCRLVTPWTRQLVCLPAVKSVSNFLEGSRCLSTSARPERPQLTQTGQCLCGSVKFKINGKMLFNLMCHCRACARARGMSPVHLVGIRGDFDVVEGEESVHTVPGIGKMEHTNCQKCGTGIYQQMKGRDYVVAFPSTFQIETPNPDGGPPSSFLPEVLQPKGHLNYENRMYNFYDDLPKYKTFPKFGPLMTNEGEIIQE